MPSYNASPAGNNKVAMLRRGVPAYAFGSRSELQEPTLLQVTNVSLTGNVATFTVLMREGNIPTVGSLLTTTGISNNGGAFNITNVSITGVSINAVTGIGTITCALTHADVVSAPAAGQGYVPVPEVAEAMVQSKSQAFAVQNTLSGGYGISWSVETPSAPSSFAAQLEGALNDVDAEYSIIGTSIIAVGTNIATAPSLVNFVRINITAVSGGTSPTVVGKILQN